MPTFGKGYGEENDFCMRAYTRGWRHVHSVDVFAQHKGGTSFGDDKPALVNENLQKLNEKHPGYDSLIQFFVRTDPLLPFRRNMDIERLVKTINGPILHVVPDLDGGTKRHIKDMMDAGIRWGTDMLLMTVLKDGRVRLESNLVKDAASIYFELPSDVDEVIELLSCVRTRLIHYHHLLSMSDDLLRIADTLKIPYDFTVHDYYTICPRINLIDDTDEYCGEPSIKVCNNCIRMNGTHAFLPSDFMKKYDDDVALFRKSNEKFLQSARKVFCPSHDTADRIKRYFTLDNVAVRPHELTIPTELSPVPKRRSKPSDTQITVAIIGAIGKHKGSSVIQRSAREAFRQGIDIHFAIIGYTDCDSEIERLDNVSVSGAYDEENLHTLLKNAKPDVIWFPSRCPETFCYTLSTALCFGLPIVAYKMGAFSERLTNDNVSQHTCLLPFDAKPLNIVEALDEMARKNNKGYEPQPYIYDLENDYYEKSDTFVEHEMFLLPENKLASCKEF